MVANTAVVSTASVVAPTTPVAAASPVAVIPGASADEDAAEEPARSVISIGRTRVWIVRVVPPLTNWSSRRIPVSVITVTAAIADADPYTNLGVCGSREKGCRNHDYSQQQQIP